MARNNQPTVKGISDDQKTKAMQKETAILAEFLRKAKAGKPFIEETLNHVWEIRLKETSFSSKEKIPSNN